MSASVKAGAVDVHLAAELLAAQARLVQAAGAGAGQVAADQREEANMEKALSASRILRRCARCTAPSSSRLLREQRLVDDVAGRRHACASKRSK